jgi:hypothetical protein
VCDPTDPLKLSWLAVHDKTARFQREGFPATKVPASISRADHSNMDSDAIN